MIRKPASNSRASNKTAAPVAAAVRPAAPVKPKPGAKAVEKPKQKVVRDSFAIPKSEYVELGELKKRAAHLERPAKKSELLRAGIGALKAMSDAAFLTALSAVPSLKTVRLENQKKAADKAGLK